MKNQIQHSIRALQLAWLLALFSLGWSGFFVQASGPYTTPQRRNLGQRFEWAPIPVPRQQPVQVPAADSGPAMPNELNPDRLNPLLGGRSGLAPSDTGISIGNLDDKQKLAVGDTIIFRVVEDQEEPRLLMVSDAGDVNVPELGLVPAVGKTCKQLAAELRQRLERTAYYKATVLVGVGQLNPTPSGRRVFVMGQVLRSGTLQIPAGESWTVSRAVAAAGGFTDFGDTKRVRLIRGRSPSQPGKVFVVNVREVWKEGKIQQDMPVQPEDIIYVPLRMF